MNIYDLPIDVAVDMADRMVTALLGQYVDEEDLLEVRRRLAARLVENRPTPRRLDWRKKNVGA